MDRVITRCGNRDTRNISEVINDSATAYRGVIPPDRYHEPYMPLADLHAEIEDGVEFSGYWSGGELLGVMGSQDRGDVQLIRHAYVRTAHRGLGIGGALLSHLLSHVEKRVLVGTWADAGWAVRFYEKHGFTLVSSTEKEILLKRYWRIPDRQIETSVVLAGDWSSTRTAWKNG